MFEIQLVARQQRQNIRKSPIRNRFIHKLARSKSYPDQGGPWIPEPDRFDGSHYNLMR